MAAGGGRFGAVAGGPEPAGDGHPLGDLHAEAFGEFVLLGGVAAVAPEACRGERAAVFAGEHLAVHLAGDADGEHLGLDALLGERLAQPLPSRW